jgi:hypothetical protein
MSRVFKTRTFNRWMRKAALSDRHLCKAVTEMERGLIDADLGGHVVKKRIALPGRGKSGSTRTLVGTNYKGRWFFLFGFDKNERANISADELTVLQEIARTFLALKDNQIATALATGELLEICDDDETQ